GRSPAAGTLHPSQCDLFRTRSTPPESVQRYSCCAGSGELRVRRLAVRGSRRVAVRTNLGATMSIRELRSKLQRKGLMGSLRLFTERYLYAHHQLIWFARELHGNPLSLPRRHAWQYVDTRSDLL